MKLAKTTVEMSTMPRQQVSFSVDMFISKFLCVVLLLGAISAPPPPPRKEDG